MSAALADTAVRLPWLAPNVASLVALTRPHRPATWPTINSDPAALLLLLRHSPHDQSPTPFRPLAFALPAMRTARDLLAEPAVGCLDYGHSAVQTVLAASRTCAVTARRLGEKTGRCDPDSAAAAGLIVHLGWLAIAAVRPDAVATCLADETHAGDFSAVQRRHWGITAGEVARRLARRWELPDWLTAVLGSLDLPVGLAPMIGVDPTLFAVVQAAVSLTGRGEGHPLRLAIGTPVEELRARLELDADPVVEGTPSSDPVPGSPYDSPLLRDLLELACENAGRQELKLVTRVEAEVDGLHRLLGEQRAAEAERLQTQKLTALAEFAAGAGHEINNPLAVISGQAQYLLGQEADPDRQRSLRTVVQQSQRIHQVLTDLMQFSRPARPQKQAVDVRDVVHQAAGAVSDLATHRQVRIEVLAPDESCVTDGDPQQLQTALVCLIRNAIEAAPVSGWARVRVEIAATDRLRIVVEDSGSGPAAAHAEHLFDPFFSGRPAGRGRGLGLPTAWRLAREQGGDVSYEPLPAGPTRFVLSLPRIAVLPLTQPERLSA